MTDRSAESVGSANAGSAADATGDNEAAHRSQPVLPHRKRRVSMSVVNFWVDATLLTTLLLIIWESATLQLVFPAPTLAGGWTLFGLTYDQCRDIQFATLCVFCFGILIHLMLHWNWICSVIATQILDHAKRPDEGMQTIYGVATLIIALHLVGAGVVVAMFFVHRPPV
jgi:hypothetical protein